MALFCSFLWLSNILSLYIYLIYPYICSVQSLGDFQFTQGLSLKFSHSWTLCDPMNSSTPGLPVHRQLPESTQTHVHWVSDAIQPSHPLSSPSPPALNLCQHQGLFKWVSSPHQVAKVLYIYIYYLFIYISMYIYLYPFICWWTFKLLPCFGYCKQYCCEHWDVCVFFVFSWYIASSESAVSYGHFIFSFWGTSILFSMLAIPIYIPTNSVEGLPLGYYRLLSRVPCTIQ